MSCPPRVAALRRNSRETVDGDLLSRRAISRTPTFWALRSAISSRSANDRYLPDGGLSWIDGMPPRSRNHRVPTGADTPQATAASSLVSPSAIFTQNARSTSRRIGGRPGERIAGRPVIVVVHPAGLPTQHSHDQVLRQPVESTQYTSREFTLLAGELGVRLPVGRTGQCWDNALTESFFATLKSELIGDRPWRSRAAAHTAVFEWIEGWCNLHRLHSSLGYRSPADYEAALAACPPHRWCPPKRSKLRPSVSRVREVRGSGGLVGWVGLRTVVRGPTRGRAWSRFPSPRRAGAGLSGRGQVSVSLDECAGGRAEFHPDASHQRTVPVQQLGAAAGAEPDCLFVFVPLGVELGEPSTGTSRASHRHSPKKLSHRGRRFLAADTSPMGGRVRVGGGSLRDRRRPLDLHS